MVVLPTPAHSPFIHLYKHGGIKELQRNSRGLLSATPTHTQTHTRPQKPIPHPQHMSGLAGPLVHDPIPFSLSAYSRLVISFDLADEKRQMFVLLSRGPHFSSLPRVSPCRHIQREPRTLSNVCAPGAPPSVISDTASSFFQSSQRLIIEDYVCFSHKKCVRLLTNKTQAVSRKCSYLAPCSVTHNDDHPIIQVTRG